MNPTPTVTSGQKFFAALFDGATDIVEFRSLPGGAQQFSDLADVSGIRGFLSVHRDEDLYFGVATRRRGSTSGKLEDCAELRALFVDIDFKVTDEPTARERLEGFPFRPSVVVRSGGGLHCYWVLKEPLHFPEDEGTARNLLQRLAMALGGDRSAAEPSRILRVPNTVNRKYTPRAGSSSSPARRGSTTEENSRSCSPRSPPRRRPAPASRCRLSRSVRASGICSSSSSRDR